MAMKSLDKSAQDVWSALKTEGESMAAAEPLLAGIIQDRVMKPQNLSGALAVLLAEKLDRPEMDAKKLHKLFSETYAAHPELEETCCLDLLSVLSYDPAAKDYITPFLFFKGFHALQSWRVAHALWQEGRQPLALFLQNRISMVFDVDIHPAARIGHGITMDHATGIVIGETAIVGNNILMLHDVTLGTRGFERGDRHPIIEDDVIIGAGAKILGRVTIGTGARVAAGSLVLEDVSAGNTVAGVPARVIKTS